jgi:hypothetical protein
MLSAATTSTRMGLLGRRKRCVIYSPPSALRMRSGDAELRGTPNEQLDRLYGYCSQFPNYFSSGPGGWFKSRLPKYLSEILLPLNTGLKLYAAICLSVTSIFQIPQIAKRDRTSENEDIRSSPNELSQFAHILSLELASPSGAPFSCASYAARITYRGEGF